MGRRDLSLVVALSIACRTAEHGEDDGGGTTAAATDGGDTTFGGSSDAATGGFDSGGADESTSGGAADDGLMGECNIWTQDCAAGDKCVPWSENPDLIPDDIRCCPEPPNPRQPGEDCTVQGYFGSCMDDCAAGSFCMDIDNDGAGVCQRFCSGDPGAPVCEPDETCLFYFAGVPICFPKCDPLVQDCQDTWGCYPDEEAAGGTGFICLPTIGGGSFQTFCWLLSSCAPGLICVTSDFLPGCNATGCCTALCDVTEPDTCAKFHSDIECVSWYYAGQRPPSVELQNVGACVIPP